MRKGFTPVIMVISVFTLSIVIGISIIVYNKLKPSPNSEFLKQIKEEYPYLSEETKRRLNEGVLTEDEYDELLKITAFSSPDPDRFKNNEADYKAQSDLHAVTGPINMCLIKNQNNGISAEKTYTADGGCADYKYLEVIAWPVENGVKANVTIYVNSEDNLICVWAQGGTIGVNNWTYASLTHPTKEAKLILEDGSRVSIPNVSGPLNNISSNPVSCEI